MNLKSILFSLLLLCLAACQPDGSPELSGDVTRREATGTVPAPSATTLVTTDTPLPATSTPVPATATPTALPTDPPPTPTATASAPPEIEALRGRWANILFTLTLRRDGNYEVVWPSETGAPSRELGTYRYEEGDITFMPDTYEETTANPFMDGCRDEQPYAYRPMLMDDVRFMRLTLVSDACHSRARNWDRAGATEDEVWQLLEAFSDG